MQTFSALFTDLYQLAMAQTYFAAGKQSEVATFDLFVRRLPEQRNYLVMAGLPQVLEFLENIRFEKDDLSYLRSLKMFSQEFLKYLQRFRFTGEVMAMKEGEVFFREEPILKVTAPLIEAQIVETALINIVHLHTLLASKASRVITASRGKPVIDFGARRAHGQAAGLAASYASYLAGAAGTSNVLAGKIYNIPVFGTMAHSYIKSFESEEKAFYTFAKTFPRNTTFLIDTYNTEEGAERAAKAAKKLRRFGITIQGVRLDSGNLQTLSKKVRTILDGAGLQKTKIFASGNLNEYKIEALEKKKAPIDAYGVGTEMTTSSDSPSLDMVYKMSQLEAGGISYPKMKFSLSKKTLPGKKQVYRTKEEDSIGLIGEKIDGTPLLRPVMSQGKSLHTPVSLERVHLNFKKRLGQFPSHITSLTKHFTYTVEISQGVKKLIKMLEYKSL